MFLAAGVDWWLGLPRSPLVYDCVGAAFQEGKRQKQKLEGLLRAKHECHLALLTHSVIQNKLLSAQIQGVGQELHLPVAGRGHTEFVAIFNRVSCNTVI